MQPMQQGGIESNSRKIPEGLGDVQLSSGLGSRIPGCVLGSVVLFPEYTSTTPSQTPGAFPLSSISHAGESDLEESRVEDSGALSPIGLGGEGRHVGVGIGVSRLGAGRTVSVPLLLEGFEEEAAGCFTTGSLSRAEIRSRTINL